MNVLALCAGVGGLELGVKLAHPAAHCVCYVEGEAYAAAVLVRRMEEKALDEAPVWSDVRTFDGRPWRGIVDCITGGYPCQPFSVAGRKRGSSDPRHLWPSIHDIIQQVEPSWCFFENVANHLSLGFEEVVQDLEALDYRVAAGLFTAEEVGASHKRERLFILAHSQHCRLQRAEHTKPGQGKTPSGRRPANQGTTLGEFVFLFPPGSDNLDAWKTVLHAYPDLEPSVLRMADGLAYRVDRIRACGNGVVPLVAAYAWSVLQDSLQVA